MATLGSEGTDPEQANVTSEFARVHQFQETIGHVSLIKPLNLQFDFVEEEPIEQAARRFLIYDREVQPTFYLEPGQIEQVPQTIAGFQAFISRGGKRSNHGVFFGNLQFNDDSQLPVAVKPHTGEGANVTESCLRDYFKNAAINKLGFFSLQPVGLVLDSSRAYSLTALEESLTTLDSIDWSNFYPDTSQNPGMVQIWSQVARHLAALHAQGSLMHGDLAARNIAVTSDSQVFFMDWEYASIDLKEPRDVKVKFGYSFTDLDVLAASLCVPPDAQIKGGIGLFAGKSGDWWEGFREFFYDEYEAFRLDYVRGTKRQAAVEEELQELRRSLEQSFKMHQSEFTFL